MSAGLGLFHAKEKPKLLDTYARGAPEFAHILDHHVSSEKRAWRYFRYAAIFVVLITLIQAISLFGLIRTGGNHLFVQTVDTHGVPVGPVREVTYVTPNATVAAVQQHLSDCIVSMYSVSPDNVVNRQNLTKAYACFAPGATAYLDSYYAAARGVNSPYIAGRTHTVEVIPQKIEGVSTQSYHVQWQQLTRGLNGAQVSSISRGATFTVAIDSGTRTTAQIVSNPFGILISAVMPDTNLQQGATP